MKKIRSWFISWQLSRVNRKIAETKGRLAARLAIASAQRSLPVCWGESHVKDGGKLKALEHNQQHLELLIHADQ